MGRVKTRLLLWWSCALRLELSFELLLLSLECSIRVLQLHPPLLEARILSLKRCLLGLGDGEKEKKNGETEKKNEKKRELISDIWGTRGATYGEKGVWPERDEASERYARSHSAAVRPWRVVRVRRVRLRGCVHGRVQTRTASAAATTPTPRATTRRLSVGRVAIVAPTATPTALAHAQMRRRELCVQRRVPTLRPIPPPSPTRRTAAASPTGAPASRQRRWCRTSDGFRLRAKLRPFFLSQKLKKSCPQPLYLGTPGNKVTDIVGHLTYWDLFSRRKGQGAHLSKRALDRSG